MFKSTTSRVLVHCFLFLAGVGYFPAIQELLRATESNVFITVAEGVWFLSKAVAGFTLLVVVIAIMIYRRYSFLVVVYGLALGIGFLLARWNNDSVSVWAAVCVILFFYAEKVLFANFDPHLVAQRIVGDGP